MKKALKNALSYFLIGIGIVFLLTPIVPGWLFIILGLVILESDNISEILRKLKFKKLICKIRVAK